MAVTWRESARRQEARGLQRGRRRKGAPDGPPVLFCSFAASLDFPIIPSSSRGGGPGRRGRGEGEREGDFPRESFLRGSHLEEGTPTFLRLLVSHDSFARWFHGDSTCGLDWIISYSLDNRFLK